MISQLVTIRFEKDDQSILVHWYHVPRAGDWIELTENDTYIHGAVAQVLWGSEQVIVRVK